MEKTSFTLRNKAQRGFIQIPILIVVLIGVAILGGTGYVAYKAGKSSQNAFPSPVATSTGSTNSSATTTVEANSPLAEIESLRNEVEILKKATSPVPTKTPSKAPSSPVQTPTPQPTAPTNPITTTIASFASSIVKLTCIRDSQTVNFGSGTLFYDPTTATYSVLTNAHVVLSSGDDDSCLVTVYPNSPLMHGALGYESVPGSFKYLNVDIASFRLQTFDPAFQAAIRSDFGDLGTTPLSELAKYAKNGKEDLRQCGGLPQLGTPVYILGYPGIGGDSLTVTNGIVSGIETDQNGKRYYKTSAKIEHGNSGGAAILESGCLLGIPTLAITGEIESLAYILPIQ